MFNQLSTIVVDRKTMVIRFYRVNTMATYCIDSVNFKPRTFRSQSSSINGNRLSNRSTNTRDIEERLRWQLVKRKENPEKVQIYGDVICYETLKCDSGMLCLDWREICDGIQHCLSGRDEENCDLLEMNQCDDDEYRCVNGMCIPDEFFLDGQMDCLDWSDEMPYKKSGECSLESVSTECDDHLCPRNRWPCEDGQCILQRLNFWTKGLENCASRREQYFICETYPRKR